MPYLGTDQGERASLTRPLANVVAKDASVAFFVHCVDAIVVLAAAELTCLQPKSQARLVNLQVRHT